jgi:hypothetical protein
MGSGKRKAFTPLILQPCHTSQNFIHTALLSPDFDFLKTSTSHYYVLEAHFNSGCCRLAFLRVEAFFAHFFTLYDGCWFLSYPTSHEVDLKNLYIGLASPRFPSAFVLKSLLGALNLAQPCPYLILSILCFPSPSLHRFSGEKGESPV